MTWKLLATASDEAGIIRAIEAYWCAPRGNIRVLLPGVLQGGKLMAAHRVVVKRGRWRFEQERLT